MTTEQIQYIFNYKKKNGTIRYIKTDRDINKKQEHILLWDCENNGWRTLIKNNIIEVKQYRPIFTYKKKNGNIRDIKTDGEIHDMNTHIRVYDIQNKGYSTLIKENILEKINFQTVSVF